MPPAGRHLSPQKAAPFWQNHPFHAPPPVTRQKFNRRSYKPQFVHESRWCYSLLRHRVLPLTLANCPFCCLASVLLALKGIISWTSCIVPLQIMLMFINLLVVTNYIIYKPRAGDWESDFLYCCFQAPGELSPLLPSKLARLRGIISLLVLLLAVQLWYLRCVEMVWMPYTCVSTVVCIAAFSPLLKPFFKTSKFSSPAWWTIAGLTWMAVLTGLAADQVWPRSQLLVVVVACLPAWLGALSALRAITTSQQGAYEWAKLWIGIACLAVVLDWDNVTQQAALSRTLLGVMPLVFSLLSKLHQQACGFLVAWGARRTLLEQKAAAAASAARNGSDGDGGDRGGDGGRKHQKALQRAYNSESESD